MKQGRSLGDLLEALNNLDLEEVAEMAIEETLDSIADRNREQLLNGFTSAGTRLGKYRSYKYALAKNALNPLPGLGNPDFKLTGDFHRAIKAELFNGTVGVHSYDSKAEKLEDRDGADNIYGLEAEQHRQYVEEDLSPVYYSHIHKSLDS